MIQSIVTPISLGVLYRFVYGLDLAVGCADRGHFLNLISPPSFCSNKGPKFGDRPELRLMLGLM